MRGDLDPFGFGRRDRAPFSTRRTAAVLPRARVRAACDGSRAVGCLVGRGRSHRRRRARGFNLPISRERIHAPRNRAVRYLDRGGGLQLRSLRCLGSRAFRGKLSLFFTLVSLPLPHRRGVVADAALVRSPVAVKVRTAEGAAEVLTSRVARIRDEGDPAVPAPNEKLPYLRLVPQDGVKDDVVFQHEPAHLAAGVPVIIRGGLKALLDFYEKKPRVSLTILILLFCMLSSYLPATNSSRGKTKAFLSEQSAAPAALFQNRGDPGPLSTVNAASDGSRLPAPSQPRGLRLSRRRHRNHARTIDKLVLLGKGGEPTLVPRPPGWVPFREQGWVPSD